MRYSNPVLPGFNPDPSVCRVGEDYYLVSGTHAYFPAIPVYHSKDLVHWRQIGSCLTRPSQAPLEHAGHQSGIWCPTIRFHEGRFYVTASNMHRGGHFIVNTDDPAGEWSEPVYVDQAGTDPSLFFDDDGAVYYSTGVAERGILQSAIDIHTGKLLCEPRITWDGTNGGFPEGPHTYKINGVYYLMIAEGGTFYGHMETIARGPSAWGPWEACPRNPILTQRNKARFDVHGTGNADLVQAHDGSWWMVFLGFRPKYGFYQHLGREAFLAPVTWDPDGWPRVYHDGWIDLEMEADCLPPRPWPIETRDDFDREKLAPGWMFMRNPDPGVWSLTRRPGWLSLKCSAVTLDDVASPACVCRRQQHFDCRAATLLDFAPTREGEEAGLTIFSNPEHHYEVAATFETGARRIIVRRRIGDLGAVVAKQDAPEGPTELFIEADDREYRFGFVDQGGASRVMASGATRYLTVEVSNSFTGTVFGLYATGHGAPSDTWAHFDWFEYRPQ